MAQSLAYHPDVRRQVARMSVELEAARLMTCHSAWLSDTEGVTPNTVAALFRAKYMVGEAVAEVTHAALNLAGRTPFSRAPAWNCCSGTAPSRPSKRRRRISASTISACSSWAWMRRTSGRPCNPSRTPF